LKKISYSLNIGLVGPKESGKEIFIDYLKRNALEASFISDVIKNVNYHEILTIFDHIPMKSRIFMAKDLDKLIYNYDKIKNLDILILALDIFEPSLLCSYEKDKLEELNEYFMFKGMTLLVGIDTESIFNKTNSRLKIEQDVLVQKAQELNVLYCFELQNRTSDLKELFDKIFGDFLFKFKMTSPDLYESARQYGQTLIK